MKYELWIANYFIPLYPIMEPLISFIVTYHNEPEDYLEACLQSIQALSSFSEEEAEIVLVDDGSRVPPTFVGSAGIHYVRQEHAGLSVARNTGIKYSRGKYLQFVDADDYIISGVYESVIEQIRGKGVDVILFRMTKKAVQNKTKRAFQVKPNSCHAISSTKGQYAGCHFLQHHNLRAAAWGYVFKREILGDLRFYPGLLHEDELFTPQLFLRAKSLLELKTEAYFYRQHEGTITHSKSLGMIFKRLDDTLFIIRELYSLHNPVLERRVRQLTLDYLQKIWTTTHSSRELFLRSHELRKEGFLPLPVRFYSLRYFVFSLVF